MGLRHLHCRTAWPHRFRGSRDPQSVRGRTARGLQFEATCNCNFANNYPYAIGPRLGLAYQIDSKTVLRAGFGVVYNSTASPTLPASNSARTNLLPANSGQITGLFKDGIPGEVQPKWPSFEPNVGMAPGSVVNFPLLMDPNSGRPARQLQWTIGLQREISRNLVVEASYVANRGVWWTANALNPLNTMSLDTLRAYGFNDFTSSTEARLLTTSVSSLTSAQKATLAARGITGHPVRELPQPIRTCANRCWLILSTVPASRFLART